MSNKSTKMIQAVFTATAPVFCGYVFVGMAYGLLLQKAGYGWWWALLTSLIVYAGSMQFVLVGLLTNPVGLLQTAIITLAVNIRHAFYGLSMIELFREFRFRKPYMIFSLTDETYSLLCSVKMPEGIEKRRFLFLISLLNQCYWVAGSVAGAAFGELVRFDSKGLDFALTALFLVIFTEQWLTAKSRIPAVIGIAAGLACLLLFGANSFLPPALALTVLALLLGRNQIGHRLINPKETGVAK